MRAIGDMFDHNHVELITVARQTCTRCYFKTRDEGCSFTRERAEYRQCGPNERTDEMSVIFMPYAEYAVARLKGEL